MTLNQRWIHKYFNTVLQLLWASHIYILESASAYTKDFFFFFLICFVVSFHLRFKDGSMTDFVIYWLLVGLSIVYQIYQTLPAFNTDSGPVIRDPQNLFRTTRTSYPVVRWTSKISSPQYCNNTMLKKLENRCHWLSPFSRNKTRVRNHEWHAFLRSRSDRSSSMLLFHKINDVETHHGREKNSFKIYKFCCCCQDH